jgi:ABC-type lipoprotein export system ATPase subunit
MRINCIVIKGLFGDRDYNIRLLDNRLILVSENGSGKTTIVNIIYYFLSNQWNKLVKYDFRSIEINIGHENIKLSKSELDVSSSPRFARLLKRYPKKIQDNLNIVLNNIDISDITNRSKLNYWSDKYDIPTSLFYEMFRNIEREQYDIFESKLAEKQKNLNELIDFQILYLPTYRRIEQDLRTILPDLDDELSKYRDKRVYRSKTRGTEDTYIELVEFGMEDVDTKIKQKLHEIETEFNDDLKNGLIGKYLKDVLNENYKNIDYELLNILDQETLDSILSRIKSTVLSEEEKGKLSMFVSEMNIDKLNDKVENKIIAYFIYRLSQIYDSLKNKEIDILKFVDICNDYSGNKYYHYDNINFNIKIYPKAENKTLNVDKTIALSDLSSGEKQIVSLFSHLFLSDAKKFFIVIDEPELSLSVPWQKKFLVDVSNSTFCKGIIAVTHSPFIFDNELNKYAQGLNVFESNGAN